MINQLDKDTNALNNQSKDLGCLLKMSINAAAEHKEREDEVNQAKARVTKA